MTALEGFVLGIVVTLALLTMLPSGDREGRRHDG